MSFDQLCYALVVVIHTVRVRIQECPWGGGRDAGAWKEMARLERRFLAVARRFSCIGYRFYHGVSDRVSLNYSSGNSIHDEHVARHSLLDVHLPYEMQQPAYGYRSSIYHVRLHMHTHANAHTHPFLQSRCTRTHAHTHIHAQICNVRVLIASVY